eukprot:2688002-Pleurochrysis_carterae.AAC.1
MGAVQARGLGHAWAVVQGRGRSEVRGPSLASTFREPKERSASGARALRKYACDAMPKRRTVH